MTKRKRKGLDAGYVKRVATGRWVDVLTSVGRIPRDVLDGRHHPCPRCGGRDRFRLFDEDAGAVLCNKCFSSANGDGLSAVQWALGVDFQEALRQVADFLGVLPTDKSTAKPPPDEHLVFQEWDVGHTTLATIWCAKKQPITVGAIKAVGGRVARYCGQFTVIAIPVWGPKLTEVKPVGWVVMNVATENGLPRKAEDGSTKWITKPKLTYGSAPGVVGDLKRLETAAVVWKVEGITDVLAMLSLPDLPPDWAVVTNSNGAQQRPVKWLCGLVAGDGKRAVHVLHDADVPGQRGSLGWNDDHGRHRCGWAEVIAKAAESVVNVELPYPMAESHGKDLRDFFIDGNGAADLRTLATGAKPVDAVKFQALEKDDDPHRLARLNIERYFAETGRVLRYWHGSWWTWDGGKYRELDENVFRARLNARIKEEFDRLNMIAQEDFAERKQAGQTEDGEHPPYAMKVTRALETNVISATRSEPEVTLSRSILLNSWIPAKEERSYIAMGNGILDVTAYTAGQPMDKYLRPLTYQWFSLSQLPYDFDPESQCPKWLAFLEQVQEGDAKRIALLQEWAGYLLLPDLAKQRFVLLEGEGANGKSSYCAGIEAILGGHANCSYVSLEQFADRFAKTDTLGKLVNISGDAPELDKVAEGVIKQFTGGTPMFFDRKGSPGINCPPTARLMIACNNRPRISDRSQGVWRRMIPIPWPVVIPDEEQIEGMDAAKWWVDQGEVSGMFNWALAGLVRLRYQRRFTLSEVVEANKAEYELESNPTKQFFSESLKLAPPNVMIRIKVLYKMYKKWMADGGYHPLGEGMFAKELRREFGLTNADKHQPRTITGRFTCYSRIDFQEDSFGIEEINEAYGHDF